MSSWISFKSPQMFTVYQVYVNQENDPKHTPTCQQRSADWKQNPCFATILSVIRSLSAVLKTLRVICPSEVIIWDLPNIWDLPQMSETLAPNPPPFSLAFNMTGEACMLTLKVRSLPYKTSCLKVTKLRSCWMNSIICFWNSTTEITEQNYSQMS